MGKYIDAERLSKAIENKGLDCSFALKMERLDTLALIDSLQQEQPEVDLEEEIQLYIENIGFGHGGWIDGLSDEDLRNIANHFYELGLNARKKETK